MEDNIIELPDLILLEDFGHDYTKYIDAVYEVFLVILLPRKLNSKMKF